MGSLLGHIVPGTFFAAVAIWWTWDTLHRYLKACLAHQPYVAATQSVRYSLAATKFGGDTRKMRPPVETVLKLTAIAIGMTGELCTAMQGGVFKEVHNAQHMTMFGFFSLHGLFELLYFYRVPFLPPGLDYLLAALAFGVEAVLFVWHLHGRSALDVQVHTFLVYSVVLCTVALLVEMARPHDVRATLLRAAFTLLQGVWFWQVGFILYPPSGWARWKDTDHDQMMIVTMIFAWDLAFVVVFQMLVALMVHRLLLRSREQLRENCAGGEDSALLMEKESFVENS